jgi:hypothetical protein
VRALQIAAAVAFLASADVRSITGRSIQVDDGLFNPISATTSGCGLQGSVGVAGGRGLSAVKFSTG